MAAAHARLDITDEAFDRVMDHLVATLESLGMDMPAIREIAGNLRRIAQRPVQAAIDVVQAGSRRREHDPEGAAGALEALGGRLPVGGRPAAHAVQLLPRQPDRQGMPLARLAGEMPAVAGLPLSLPIHRRRAMGLAPSP
jgi:hypothetical protein